MFLAYDTLAAEGTSTWSAYVSTVSSIVEESAKGCLMAREAEHKGSVNFAVCRPADEDRIVVQVRRTSSDDTESFEAAINPPGTIDDDSAAFLRLEVTLEGGRTLARGYASQDGEAWVLVREETFPQPLVHQGLAASGDGSMVRMLFGNVSRVTGAGPPLAYRSGTFARVVSFGDDASGRVFDGPVPP